MRSMHPDPWGFFNFTPGTWSRTVKKPLFASRVHDQACNGPMMAAASCSYAPPPARGRAYRPHAKSPQFRSDRPVSALKTTLIVTDLEPELEETVTANPTTVSAADGSVQPDQLEFFYSETGQKAWVSGRATGAAGRTLVVGSRLARPPARPLAPSLSRIPTLCLAVAWRRAADVAVLMRILQSLNLQPSPGDHPTPRPTQHCAQPSITPPHMAPPHPPPLPPAYRWMLWSWTPLRPTSPSCCERWGSDMTLTA